MIAHALSALQAYPQFILYRLEPKPGGMNKIPCDNNTLRKADAHNPAIWMTYEIAECMAECCGPEYGVGFVLTDRDPFFCL